MDLTEFGLGMGVCNERGICIDMGMDMAWYGYNLLGVASLVVVPLVSCIPFIAGSGLLGVRYND